MDVAIDHLLLGGALAPGLVHDDEPVLVVAPGEQRRHLRRGPIAEPRPSAAAGFQGRVSVAAGPANGEAHRDEPRPGEAEGEPRERRGDGRRAEAEEPGDGRGRGRGGGGEAIREEEEEGGARGGGEEGSDRGGDRHESYTTHSEEIKTLASHEEEMIGEWRGRGFLERRNKSRRLIDRSIESPKRILKQGGL